MIWQDWNGRAGVQFVDVPKTSRRLLTEFLATNLPRETAWTANLPDVTVEVEEPLQLADGLSRGANCTEAEPRPRSRRVRVRLRKPASRKSDADNRRTQARYACRLGAEVYRTGDSVPNHCCLTDLSSGGCYLEVPLPFPQGSSVEIVVRTHEMKLRLRGAVQASHPGYGMGVAFELKTKDEQANVKKLIDFVASTTEPSN